MEENFSDFRAHPVLLPVRMLAPEPRCFQASGRPIESLRQIQSFLARQGPQYGDLFGAWLFVKEHDDSVVENRPSIKAQTVTFDGICS